MKMIRTDTATITDICYAQQIPHNKYLPQFSSITTIISSTFIIIYLAIIYL